MRLPDASAALDELIRHPDQVVAVLRSLEGLNFVGAAEALRAGDTDVILENAENFLSFLALFVPQAQIAMYAVMFLLFARKTEQAGLWHPATGDEAAAQARDARDHRPGGK